MTEYDYIIIGSGFGGSVSALRLSEKGYKVLVIEKGKWYHAKDFPKTNWNLRKWLWMPSLKLHGIMKLSVFSHVGVLSGVGVGGGSLVYACTLPVPKSPFFKSGNWAHLNDWEEDLKPYYKTAQKMLGVATNPKFFDGDIALQKVAKSMNIENSFEPTNVGIYFDEENVTKPDPYFNGEGPERTGCNFCGACMTGCRNNSKNTLDKNYLYLAQKKGATILAENEVYDVKVTNNGDYEVYTKSSTSIIKQKKKFKAKGVVFSGGVMGTIKLLLKLKKKSLPKISDTLGTSIRTNNETLIGVTTLDTNKNASKGVAIGSILHADENSHMEPCRYSEGSGFWKLLFLPYTSGKNIFSRAINMFSSILKSPLDFFKIYFVNSWSKSNIVLLFMQTLDSTLAFRINSLGIMTSSVSTGKKPSPYIPESEKLAKEYNRAFDGKMVSFVQESLLGIPTTAHILGGAVMGENISEGVIDKDNHVFGYDNMYVIDGSMISSNPGVNPSLTITAIAERAMSKIPSKQ